MNATDFKRKVSQYDVRDIVPSPLEVELRNRVRYLMEHDSRLSPFSTGERWYNRFERENKVGSVGLETAPDNQLLIVVTESLGTLLAVNDRGVSLMRGSIIMKLEDNLIYGLDALSWYASTTGPQIFPCNGFFYYDKLRTGAVKVLRNVSV